MPELKQCVILNPNAGAADQTQLLEGLKVLGSVALFTLQAAGEGAKVAREAAADGFTRIIVAGGDGTLNEVVNGLADHFADVELGIIPLGTGNDFDRSMNIPAEVAGAVALLEQGVSWPVDVVNVTSEACPTCYFINVSAGGFSAIVDEKLQKEHKDWLGSLAYGWSALKALPELSAFRLRLTFDDQPPEEMSAYNVVIANARYVAGGIPVAPLAELDDGLLDVLIFREMPLAKIALLLPKAMVGEHQGDEDVIYRQAARVSIAADPPFHFNTDGEAGGCSPATFEVLPKALRVIGGASSP